MRPIRTIAPLALGLAALAVAGCQRPYNHGGADPDPGRAGRFYDGPDPPRHPAQPADQSCAQAHIGPRI